MKICAKNGEDLGCGGSIVEQGSDINRRTVGGGRNRRIGARDFTDSGELGYQSGGDI